MKRIGYIDARRVRYVADGVTKFAIHSWGVVIGGVAGSMSLYLAADYGAYLNSWAAGKLEVCASNEVRMRVAGKGFSVVTGGHAHFNYNIISTATIDVVSGALRPPSKTSPVTQPPEGYFWYNSSRKKLEFSTDTGMETVDSS